MKAFFGWFIILCLLFMVGMVQCAITVEADKNAKGINSDITQYQSDPKPIPVYIINR